MYLSDMGVWFGISITIAIIGAVLVYVLFLNPKSAKEYKGFVKYLYELLSFKKLLIELILKISYIFLAIFITISSFALIAESFALFLAYLILGNIVVRIIYECSLMFVLLYKNVCEINKKLK